LSASIEQDYLWLAGDEAAGWLQAVAGDRASLVVQASRLRKHLSASRAGLVLEQVELRRHAREKFPQADCMFFTRKGLQQATDHWVADYKSRRFPPGEPLADLCCGLGGDLLALARRGPAVGCERDPLTALLAQSNLRALGVTDAGAPVQVRVEDAARFPVAEVAAWHIDPDRRPEGRRTTHLEGHQPDLDALTRLLSGGGDAAVKLAPATELPAAWAARAEAEWISRGRQCRQLVAWFGRLARHLGRRSATIVGDRPGAGPPGVRTVVESAVPAAERASRPGRYLLEPDPAVLAAGLADVLAAEYGLWALTHGGGYLTGDRAITDDPALECFEVTDVLPFDLKRLKQRLAAGDVGTLEIKKRGVAQDPQELRRRLGLRGSQPAVLLLAPIGSTVTAILARRERE
jgi:SAM-dependent methyltransferase